MASRSTWMGGQRCIKRKGERAEIHLPNCPQYPISCDAVLSLGAIIVNLNLMYRMEELKLMVKTTGMTTQTIFDLVPPTVRALCKETPVPRVVVTGVTDYVRGFGVSTAKSLELEEGWHPFSTLLEG